MLFWAPCGTQEKDEGFWLVLDFDLGFPHTH